ncbi:hypothetical protein L1987_45938 [Smallanthus sonchifolius]|uniref:Uncharacterized protein n=1 Tax=Smallanthus sonchifolius TaxID=185202 RepID=A0ACB9FY80_9ASTR|nr:hypothetical protein L1987_45938 [Smallanthus sonchifolius]
METTSPRSIFSFRPPTRCPLPFTFFDEWEDANREGLPTTRSSNLVGEELKTGKKALRNRRCSQCTAIRTQTLDQAGTGDQSSIDSSISNKEKTESRRGQLSSNWLNPLWWPAPSLAHS